MIIRSLKFSTKLILILSILFILSCVSLFAWVITGPRSLSSITPSIERELSSLSDRINVTIEESYIKWDKDEKAVVIEVSNISVLNQKSNKPFAKFPKIAFDFSLLSFLNGNVVSSDITLINPSFYLDATKKSLYFNSQGVEDAEENAVLNDVIESLKHGKYRFPVNSIRLKDADLFISNGFSDFVWHATDGYIRIDKKSSVISELNLNFGKEKTYLGAEISYKEGVYDNQLKFTGLPSYILSDLFPKNEILKNVNIVSSGNVNFLISEEGEMMQSEFDISNVTGNVELAEIFAEKFEIVGAKAKGSFYDGFSTLVLDKFDAKIDDSLVLVSGKFSNLLPSPDFAPSIKADVLVRDFQVNDLHRYWPILLGETVRGWVIDNITGAKVDKASGTFNFKPEYFNRIYEWKRDGKVDPIPRMDEDAIDALIEVENAKVTYLDPYPHINDISGTVSFTGKEMKAKVKSAKINDSAVNNAIVVIEDMYAHNSPVKISGEFDGYVRDSVAFLKPALKEHRLTKHLDSIYNATGTLSGKVEISFPITASLTYDQFGLEIDSRFSDVKLPAFLNGYDVTESSFDLKLKDNDLNVDGTFSVLNDPLKISYSKDITVNRKADYTILGKITPEKLKKLGIADITSFVKKDMQAQLSVREREDTTYLNGTIDLTNAEISIPQADFFKEVNKKSKVVLVLNDRKENNVDLIEVKSFVLSGDDFEINGSLKINNSKITSFEIAKAKYKNNDYSLNYKLANNKHITKLSGKMLDLSSVSLTNYFKENKKEEKSSFSFKAAIDSVIMKNSESLSKLTLDMDCSPETCSSINAYAKGDKDSFVALSVKPVGKNYSFMLETDNAGSVINAFGISKHIEEGRLTVESTFSKDDSGLVAQGLVQIRDFKAIKTPILGKLLTLASLKGISDLLNNNGIHFERFAAPFHVSRGVITLHDAKTAGSSIGITSEGTVDMNSGHIDLSGAIVPAYEVNKVLGDIPLLGNLLVGKKNEGVIATKYRVKGPYEDVKITVNPLTILTPGFLRNIFDIF